MNFDLDEFIAYLLTGGLLVLIVGKIFEKKVSHIMPIVLSADNPAGTLALAVIFGSFALIAGHFCSIVSRYITRNIIWFFTRRPREIPFYNQHHKFWHPLMKTRLRHKLAQDFGSIFDKEDTEDYLMQASKFAPRLVRAKVLHECECTRTSRLRIVRARSFVANSVTPLCVLAYLFYIYEENVASGICIFISVLLMVKQHDLDKREWKEIYSAYLR